MSETLTKRPRRRPDILAKEGPDSSTVILLDPQTGAYYTLEGIGERIWELCDGTRTISEMVAVVEAEYDALQQTIERDVLDLLADLESERLVSADGE